MAAVLPSKVFSMSLHGDPKKAIIEGVGKKIDSISVFGSRLLVGTYIEPEKTAGGIIKPNVSVQESLWQGIVGLVLKTGKSAFVDDDLHRFNGETAKVGDWVIFRFSDAWEFHLNGVSVRMLADTSVMAIIDAPETVVGRPTPGIA